MFNYALAQNKGHEEDFKAALKQTVPHLFGDHQSCGQWCGYHQGQQSYKHKGLPYGRPLTGDSLREDMDAIFRVFIANSDKIAPGGSTKDVESFNNMVATKAPKRMYLSSSDSLLNRVACAVAQKNDGHSYINTLNNSLCMSPGRLMAERAELKRRRSAK
ncbi:hypothetical protein DPMN_116301 [Dreissena polymorpha]|uniref:Uncharacterized protein n=1 Tax=Dreissena polymorpha TaxID=45954 RepID=A0A9D4KMU1_DREPO|nr:hypothetical protein DPMN_116301 [Dreissena polymorpha]